MQEQEKLESYISIDDYLTQEIVSESKHEYSKGKIIALSGGSVNHSIISLNTNTALSNLISKKQLNCTPFNSDLKLYIDTAQSFVYPDGMVVCGDIETSPKDRHAIINPILIIEVLSKSTAYYDRGEKFRKYCSLPSFKEYILIDQYKPVVDILYRAEPSYWKMTTTIGLDKNLFINTLDAQIAMSSIYQRVINLENP